MKVLRLLEFNGITPMQETINYYENTSDRKVAAVAPTLGE